MHLVAARGPGENARRIANGAHKIIGFRGDNASLAAFGVGVDFKMIVIKGRLLPAPTLTLGHALGHEVSITPTAASWNLLNKQLAKPITITNWSVLRLGGVRLEKAQIDLFRGALKNCGLGEKDPLNPRGFHAPLPGSEANDAEIQKIFNAISQAKVKIVLVILPIASKSTYARVKYWGDVRTGIHSVCVLAQNLNKGIIYYANVVLKFNLKCGGVNPLLPDQLGFLNEGRTMVVGIDVTHPAPKSMVGNPSIAAVVASIDSDYGRKTIFPLFKQKCLGAPPERITLT